MEAKLVVVGGDAKTKELTLKLPATIGRSREAAVTLAHPLVSRQHCEIYERDGKLMVRDLGSLNGTFVGKERITESELPPGSLLTVGTVTFRAVYGDMPPEVDLGGEEVAAEEPVARPTEAVKGRGAATVRDGARQKAVRKAAASPQPTAAASGTALGAGKQTRAGRATAAEKQPIDFEEIDEPPAESEAQPAEPGTVAGEDAVAERAAPAELAMEIVEDVEPIAEVEDAEELEDVEPSEPLDDAEDVEAIPIEEVAEAEEVEDVEDVEDIEPVEELEEVEDVEEVAAVEWAEPAAAAEDSVVDIEELIEPEPAEEVAEVEEAAPEASAPASSQPAAASRPSAARQSAPPGKPAAAHRPAPPKTPPRAGGGPKPAAGSPGKAAGPAAPGLPAAEKPVSASDDDLQSFLRGLGK